MSGTVRRVCFTLNNWSEDEYKVIVNFIKHDCKYGIVGKEIAPATGTPHLQGFFNIKKPMRFNALKKLINNSIHLEKAAGSDEDNKKYCSKTGDFFEAGEPQSQGKRNDLHAVVDTIQAGARTMPEIAAAHPTSFIRYHRGIKEYLRAAFPIPCRYFKTEVRYFYGAPGTGKSRQALEEAQTIAMDEIYYKPRGLWWDGYYGHKCVIIDDFYGWIKYDEMLKIMDRYPYKVQVKGGFEEFVATHIWITSNVDTDLLYKFDGYKTDAFDRRITIKKFFSYFIVF